MTECPLSKCTTDHDICPDNCEFADVAITLPISIGLKEEQSSSSLNIQYIWVKPYLTTMNRIGGVTIIHARNISQVKFLNVDV